MAAPPTPGIGTVHLASQFDSDRSPSGDLPPDTEAHAPGSTPDDVRFMRQALQLASQGAGQVAPNPLVGAVIVQQGVVVGQGWHQRYGGAHAEVNALQQAGTAARGSTAYVSLEPCNHHGQTGPCTEALLEAGVARVVCATGDPNPTAAGGAERLRAAGVEVVVGVCEQEALLQNAPFFHAARGADLPFVTLKLAVSIDGAIVEASRRPGWLTGPETQAAVHALRGSADAVAVGIGTALADNPALTVRLAPAPRIQPARVVFDRLARLPTDGALVRSARDVPVYTVVAPAAPATRVSALATAGVTVVQAADLTVGLRELRARGVRHLLVEGGAELASALMAAGLVHHLIIFQAPVILGAGALPAFAAFPGQSATTAPRLRVLERRGYGADLMTRYAVSGD